MLLRSATGTQFEISPIGYQFPYSGTPTGGEDDDANWLVLRGIATSTGGQASEFTDPCLMTTEARELTEWLRATAAGRTQPEANPSEDELWMFIEPNLAWSVASRTKDRTTIRIHLSLEAHPTWAPAAQGLFETFILMDLSNADLDLAATEWERELAAYPIR